MAVSPAPSHPGVDRAAVVLESADLLSLHATPKVLVPAVAGAVILPITCLLNYVYGGVPYVDGGGNLVLELGSGLAAWATHVSTGFWDQDVNELLILNSGASDVSLHASATWLEQPLQLGQDTASPTSGNGIVMATVVYLVVPA